MKIKNHLYIIVLIDMFLLLAALVLAHLIRFEFDIPSRHLKSLKWALLYIISIKMVCFYLFDLYRGMFRYTSIADLLNIIKASTISSLIIIAFLLFGPRRFIGFSRSVYIIDWCLTILLISGFRLGIRFYFESVSSDRSFTDIIKSFIGPLNRKQPGILNLLIVGGGNCGEKIYREIRDNAQLMYNVVGFLDDNPDKIGKKIHGIPVLNNISELKQVANKMNVQEILIAIPSANYFEMRRIVALCKECGVKFKTVPGYGELIDGRVTINAIREVSYQDLLGRESIKLDEEKIGGYLKNQRVLVTGAGGSIGSELCRQICRFEPEKILLFERAESPLQEIELELKKNFKHLEIVAILGDIQDKGQIEKTFERHNPQTVFHAAAYKHVPMLEIQPWKAIDNNIMGTANLVEIVNQFNVERFVLVSTDKAVRPTNVMGATKRVIEMLTQGQNDCNLSQTRFMIVRFGNVVGSVGSVVPLFKKQIKTGGPVTVTHPEVTRFFMTIPEACQLILQAGSMGRGGEIFLLDMGTPIKINDMARDLIRLSGFEPDEEIQIEYIGLRPGEKLYEELITDGEDIVPTDHEKIMVLRGVDCDLQLLNGKIDELVCLAREQDGEKIKSKLHEIVPEYKANGT